MAVTIQGIPDHQVDAAVAAVLIPHQLLLSAEPHEAGVYERMTQTHDVSKTKVKG